MPTERDIQVSLISRFWSGSQLLMPNYTPRDWWECDLFRVTKAGYFYEYEIKLSLSDFRADRKKTMSRYGRGMDGKWGYHKVAEKHKALRERRAGPKCFYWVMPEGLVRPSEIEDWAGIIHVLERSRLQEFRPALPFDRPKVERKEIQLARERAYFRYLHGLGSANREEKKENP